MGVPSGALFLGATAPFFIAEVYAACLVIIADLSFLPFVFLVFILVATAWLSLAVFAMAGLSPNKILATFLAVAWLLAGYCASGLVFDTWPSHLAATAVVADLERFLAGCQPLIVAVASLGLVYLALA